MLNDQWESDSETQCKSCSCSSNTENIANFGDLASDISAVDT